MQRPHAVFIPFPAQGHINPMMKFAKLLHHRGFFITFVNTDFIRRRLLRSQGSTAVDDLPTFRFESIPDGLPPSDADAAQDIPSLCYSISTTCLPHFLNLLRRLNHPTLVSPPITCIVSDSIMTFSIDAAAELSIPVALFSTPSACGFLALMQYHILQIKGIIPLNDESDLSNGYLNTVIDWIPGMGTVQLRHLTSFLRTTDSNDTMLRFIISEMSRAPRAAVIIINTFDELDKDILSALSTMLPPIYTIGPLHLLSDRVDDTALHSIGSSLWAEERECIDWLDGQKRGSVLYVNFGSITVLTAEQLAEFAFGLANSETPFLWVIRPDMVSGATPAFSSEFIDLTKGRSMVAKWCPQVDILRHQAVGAFLTHCGWNSVMESIAAGVPLLCWPFFADQETNCLFCCERWGVGMELGCAVERTNVAQQVREIMNGKRGDELRRGAVEWKEKATEATTGGGSSLINLHRLIEVLPKMSI